MSTLATIAGRVRDVVAAARNETVSAYRRLVGKLARDGKLSAGEQKQLTEIVISRGNEEQLATEVGAIRRGQEIQVKLAELDTALEGEAAHVAEARKWFGHALKADGERAAAERAIRARDEELRHRGYYFRGRRDMRRTLREELKGLHAANPELFAGAAQE